MLLKSSSPLASFRPRAKACSGLARLRRSQSFGRYAAGLLYVHPARSECLTDPRKFTFSVRASLVGQCLGQLEASPDSLVSTSCTRVYNVPLERHLWQSQNHKARLGVALPNRILRFGFLCQDQFGCGNRLPSATGQDGPAKPSAGRSLLVAVASLKATGLAICSWLTSTL